MDENDSKKRKEVALQSVVNNENISDLCGQTLEDDLAILSSRNSNHQSHGKFTFGRKQGKFTSRKDKSPSRESGLCFSCGGSGHHAAEYANNKDQLLSCRKKTNHFAHIEKLNENDFHYNDKEEKDDTIGAFKAQVQKLLESQKNLMNQIHVLKANNVLYYEANQKQLLELNEANDKVIHLNIGVEKFDKMLSFGKLHGDKNGLDYMDNGSSLMALSLDLFPHVIIVVNWVTFVLSVGNFTLGRMIF
ncbi:hypothetical protein D8674_030807 [Pyrus ussuriensis x Pyrus communis]|uniref:Uncharacterized protein n=1 Tax=Pyrus ussuriensis x Pyrus communis TaxID=2448454 RepID=A0A5N5EX88_9ROSA|nr:hypothetical protein D8674_030807 [Pyrus ussuriensis x Pyrus communis]